MSDDTATAVDRLRTRLHPGTLPLRQKLGLAGLGFLIALPFLLWLPVVGPVMTALLPASSPTLGLYELTGALFFALYAVSWDVVSGYTGEISFGHGLFFAVGAYTSALLNLGHGIPPVASIPAGIALAAVAGVVIGVPALRLDGPYLSLVTLVAPLIMLQLFVMFSGIFGGELGLSNPDNLIGMGYVPNYFLALALFVAVLGVTWVVTRSNTGSILTAIREDDDAVAAAGMNPAKFKIYAFVLSAAIGGLAGAAYVHTPNGQPTPSELMTVLINVQVIIAAVVGGMGTIVGAALGGLFIKLAPSYLDMVELTVPLTGYSISEMSFFIFAIITLALLNVFPGGVLRWAIALGRKQLGGEAVAADGGTTPVEQTIEKYREYYRQWVGGEDR